MPIMLPCRRALPALVIAAALAGGCSRRAPQPPAPRSATAGPAAPDTAALGAGPVAANCGIPQMPQQILQMINAARAQGHRCGARAMPPAGPLHWDPSLSSAAAGHSLDMARRNYFEHRTPEGGTVRERAAANHYDWRTVGENIAGGERGVAEVVQGWMASPQHCENIMDAGFRDVGVACAAQPGSEWGTYWTMVLASRRTR